MVQTGWVDGPNGLLSNVRVPYDSRLDGILVYCVPQVLAAYREQPDKYSVVTDNFAGTVTLADAYYMRLAPDAREKEALDVRFGYRTLRSGDLSLAVFGPDLSGKSRPHLERWIPFVITDGDWLDYDSDERFSMFVRRYIEGDWGVDNGPGFYLLEEIKLLNGLTAEAAGCSLFKTDDAAINFPIAQNTHRYEDAHRHLYGLLVDGLSKPCIQALAGRLGRGANFAQMKPLTALERACPTLRSDTRFTDPLANVSKQRAHASHGIRPPAEPMRAFEVFLNDIGTCLTALRILRTVLETELKMNAEKSRDRQAALRRLPRIARPPEANYSINGARGMVGKIVESVDIGLRHDIKGVHQSEVMIIHFSDGSIMSIDTGCNAGNFDCEKHRPDDFHVDLHVQWVQPRS